MIAYCGLTCEKCPIYLATRTPDRQEQERMRAEIAGICNQHYGAAYSADDIDDCDGCRTGGGRLFFGCEDCAIRRCAGERGLENCAQCADYVCAELEKFFVADPGARARLAALRPV